MFSAMLRKVWRWLYSSYCTFMSKHAKGARLFFFSLVPFEYQKTVTLLQAIGATFQ